MEMYHIGNIFWTTGPWQRKLIISEKRRNDHSSPWVEPASYILGAPDDTPVNADGSYPGDRDAFLPSAVYTIPNHEFCDLAYELPDFKDCPLFWNAWHGDGEPDRFVVQNIQDGDTMAIMTEGYDYARYRASCKRLMPVV